jgi:hypothetical protein
LELLLHDIDRALMINQVIFYTSQLNALQSLFFHLLQSL